MAWTIFSMGLFIFKLNLSLYPIVLQAEAEGSLIVKRFALNFVSEFSALFYAAFVLKDLARVRILSILSFGIHAVSD